MYWIFVCVFNLYLHNIRYTSSIHLQLNIVKEWIAQRSFVQRFMNLAKSYIVFTVYQSRNKFRYTLTRKPRVSQWSTNILMKLAQLYCSFVWTTLFYERLSIYLFHTSNTASTLFPLLLSLFKLIGNCSGDMWICNFPLEPSVKGKIFIEEYVMTIQFYRRICYNNISFSKPT